MTLLVAVLAAASAFGLYLVVTGFGASDPKPVVRDRGRSLRTRVVPALALAGPAALLTRWPVAAVGLGAVGWFWSDLFGTRASRARGTQRTEAIAAWTEMLRDTIAGAHGLEEAIASTAPVAPRAIEAEVAALAARIERQPLTEALKAFAEDLSHPTADLVVTSLTLSARGAVGDLVELLGTLAVAARDEAGMRLRVEAARARLRTAVRVITGCTMAMAVGLILLNRSYLDVYGTPMGQVVLAAVVAMWGAGLWWLARMGEFVAPERFLALVPEDER